MKINAEKSKVHEWLGVLDEASKGKHYPKLWKKGIQASGGARKEEGGG